jgi:hypothetical protein
LPLTVKLSSFALPLVSLSIRRASPRRSQAKKTQMVATHSSNHSLPYQGIETSPVARHVLVTVLSLPLRRGD